MSTTLLRVRYIQFLREIKTLGLAHKLLFSLLFLAAIVISHRFFQSTLACYFLVAALWIFAILVQLYRPDKNFIFLHFPKPKQAIFLEYAVVALPFILPALLSPNWFCFFIFLAGLYPITFIRYTFPSQTRFVFLGRLFPPNAFEWISAFRQYLPLLIPVYFLALALSWVKILPLILLWIFSGILLGTFQLSEPLNLLRAVAQEPKTLIRKKILEMGKILLLFCLPVLLLQTFFHPWLGLAGIAFLVLQFCVFTFAILLKYSAYEPNKTQQSNMLLLAFAQISVVLPFFLLLPLALVFRQYRRAKQNLTHYLPPC